ncbi:MAG: oligosaccharide flippase family protein [Anaerolineaceae bacterium]|nr:oligosaccharide flippase family protein [Anaerolineaceae bacterium]MDE0328712.1 oligosaccharide flippase family protein [Anaerolineaceae bacterium]
MLRRFAPDLRIVLLLVILPLLLFWQQTLGGRTLLPADNLYQFEPWASHREQVGAPARPHNALVSDLVLQNYSWKRFLRESLEAGEAPLWNPYQFSGIPFLAAGQHSGHYTFSLIHYILPLWLAYGWFTVFQLWVAGAGMYVFMRGLRTGRFGSVIAALAWQLSAFLVIGAVFPMILAAVTWLPLLLLLIEFCVRDQTLAGRPARLLWTAFAALVLTFALLAGHAEMTYYILLVAGIWGLARLLQRRQAVGLRDAAGAIPWLLAAALIGVSTAALQLLPLIEFAGMNFRSGSASYEQVIGWAHPPRDLIQFLLPNFYGSPAQQDVTDIFNGQVVSLRSTEWGIKNYVEAALYSGLLTLALAALALGNLRRPPVGSQARGLTLFFLLLTLAGLSFMFGLPGYRLLWLLPGIDQLHSPFRWVFAVSLGLAVLAGLGAERLVSGIADAWRRRVGQALTALGLATLAGLLALRLLFTQLEPMVERAFRAMALADQVFPDAQTFASFQAPNFLVFALVALGAGLILLWAGRNLRARAWQVAAACLLALDLMLASGGFHGAADPALLEFTPPAIEWLQGQPGAWRYITLEGERAILPANSGMVHGLRDIRGYESIIPRQYVDFMQGIADQRQLPYNRVAPLYVDQLAAVDWERLALTGTRWLLTEATLDVQAQLPAGSALAWEDPALRIYELPAHPLAWLAVTASPLQVDALPEPVPVEVLRESGREKTLRFTLPADAMSQLVVSETWMPGWRAWLRPVDSDVRDELELPVTLVLENFQGVTLERVALEARFGADLAEGRPLQLRMTFSPASFQIGFFGSVIGSSLMILVTGIWMWQLLTRRAESDVARVARNSIAPILVNLFNRGIDFAFALVMLRILGPTDAGVYFYAGFIFLWFDILSNFGLDVWLTREVAREPTRALRVLVSSSALRLALTFAGLLLLAAFLLARQELIAPPLGEAGLLTIVLLYLGIFPGSLAKGLTSLFYGFQRAELPAAVTSIATISKTVFGLFALLAGAGVVGLAAVSIVTNLLTLVLLTLGARPLLRGMASGRPELPLMRRMTGASWPLLANHFLATIFFQVDVLIIEAIHGARMLGLYSVAYKWVAALNIIPAFFTQALLPVMSRQAQEDRETLKRTCVLGIKLLVMLALPLAALFTALAWALTSLLGGAQYLPDGAIATQLMVWSIPVGWVNSFLQYALIALDLQRRITRAFLVAVGFNVVANLLLIPTYGYQAAALTTIASEVILLLPFVWLLQRALGPLPWGDILWRPALATALLLLVLAGLWPLSAALALLLGGALYALLLWRLRPLSSAERSLLQPLLPQRLRDLSLPTLRP